jgi:transglutaminase-like putative cysteine protease
MMSDDVALPEDLPAASLDITELAGLELLDPSGIDWPSVQRTAYLVHQHLHYDYPGPITNLVQRLMILPPPRHGDQQRIMYRLDVTPAPGTRHEEDDEFGNAVVTVSIPAAEHAVDFEAWIVVERRPAAGPLRISASTPVIQRLLEPSPRTYPDRALREVAARLACEGSGMVLAERISSWTHESLRYEFGSTDVHTTAAQALELGRGVCQDSAHLMIAVCRLCGLPARYVSGHLLGEGGTHAWVEVLLPDPDHPDWLICWPFDPANGCRGSLRYVTIAVGRDYGDVAPTSGSYYASYPGALHTRKTVKLTAAEYVPGAVSR